MVWRVLWIGSMKLTFKIGEHFDSCDLTHISIVMEQEEIHEDGYYHPVGTASSLDEAKELSQSHYEHSDPDNDPAPYLYRLFARKGNGRFVSIGYFLAE